VFSQVKEIRKAIRTIWLNVSVEIAGMCHCALDARQNDKKQTSLSLKARLHKAYPMLYRLEKNQRFNEQFSSL
jgi:hypothetical protein